MKLRTSRSSTERGALNRWDDEGGAPVGPVRSRSGKAQDGRIATSIAMARLEGGWRGARSRDTRLGSRRLEVERGPRSGAWRMPTELTTA
jgi:hypothetical protein